MSNMSFSSNNVAIGYQALNVPKPQQMLASGNSALSSLIDVIFGDPSIAVGMANSGSANTGTSNTVIGLLHRFRCSH